MKWVQGHLLLWEGVEGYNYKRLSARMGHPEEGSRQHGTEPVWGVLKFPLKKGRWQARGEQSGN